MHEPDTAITAGESAWASTILSYTCQRKQKQQLSEAGKQVKCAKVLEWLLDPLLESLQEASQRQKSLQQGQRGPLARLRLISTTSQKWVLVGAVAARSVLAAVPPSA